MSRALLLFCLVACGATGRERVVHDTLISVRAARVAFADWNTAHEAEIVAKTTSEAQGQAELAPFRAKVDRVEKLYEATIDVIASAAVLKDDQSFADMQQTVLLLFAAIAGAKGGLQ